MSKRTWQTPNPLPLLHRQEPIRERLACWRKIPVPGPITQQKKRKYCLQDRPAEPFYHLADRLVGQVKGRATF